MQVAITKIQLVGGLMNNNYLFLTILKAGKSRIMAQTDLASGEGLHFLFHRWHLFPVDYMAEGQASFLWSPL